MRILMALIMLAMFSVTIAQEDDFETTCDVEALVERQAELTALLEDFAAGMDDTPEATLAALYEVGLAYQALALDCGHIPENVGELTVGTDVAQILRVLEDVNGDPLNGQLLYNSIELAADGRELGCSGCHMNVEVAPLTEGTWTRWDEMRRAEAPEYEDFAYYMVESIVLPWDYTVPDYPTQGMPNNFGDRLSYQDLADLIAYLESQDQLLD